MIKRILVTTLAFLVGIAVATLFFFNPAGWTWVDSVHQAVFSPVDRGEVSEVRQWTCGMHPDVIRDEPGSCPLCGMPLVPVEPLRPPAAAAEAEELWTCGMHPEVIRHEPGSCPICGMPLVPLEVGSGSQGEEDLPGLVTIDPAFVQNIGVQSEEVERRDIPFQIRTIGNLVYNEGQISWINTKYEGWIEKVYVNYVGEPVQKGQKLLEIYSPQLVTTQTEFLQAMDYLKRLEGSDYPEIVERARALLQSSRQRLLYWDVTDAQIAELERSRKPTRTLTLFSPASGLVAEKADQALQGMKVMPGMNLYKLVDLSTIWVEAEVFENQLPWLRVGQFARIEIPHLSGQAFTGTVRYLYPFVQQETRTLKVSIELRNPGQRLRADMYADVTFDVPSARNVLTVAEESVIHSGERNLVVIDLSGGRFQVREVELGLNGDGVWEVRKGLEEGDKVVVSSQFLIDSESNLREAIRKMSSAQPAQEVPVNEPAGHLH